MTVERIGIIDLGSNSSRFLIYELHQNGAYHPIFEMKRNIRLANHLDADKRILPEGLAKAINCTKLFYRTGELYGVTQWIAVATAAVRQAANQAQFLEAVKAETNVSFRVLSGDEEGRYGYIGVVNTLDVSDAILFDIGGASTEVMHVQNRRLLGVVSIPYGAVNLTEQFKALPSDHQGTETYRFMKEQFLQVPWLAKLNNLPLVGLGGTARALAKMDRSKKDVHSSRLHGYEITRNSFNQLFKEIKSSSIIERKKIKGISKQRADLLVAGCATAAALVHQISAQKIIISRSGLREGIAYEYLLRHTPNPIVESVLEYSISNFQKLFKVNDRIAAMLTNATMYFFDSLQPLHGLSENERKILWVTAQIEGCGCYINTEKWTKHSAYLALYSHLHGLEYCDFEKIADLLCGKNDATTKKMSLLIRLAKLTCLQVGIELQDLTCEVKKDRVYIGKAPGMKQSVSHSADADLDLEFKIVFGARIEYIEDY
jgi:exopolyphosphatase/guanosine-5'-triphosphate,3'-diphosphate pyrophosphatase